MTTLLLQAADGLINAGVSAVTSVAAGVLTGTAGAAASGGASRVTEGPRLVEMDGLSSTEGAPIPRVYGRARLGGQLIWATRFEEIVTTSMSTTRSPSQGGKSFGSGSGAKTTTTTSTSYSYVANIAVGLCEGPIAFVRRVWADAEELDLTTVTMRVHRGGEDQAPDPLIAAKEGAENAPAYRGLAYVVFERLPLGPYGNRVPQLSFEVVRPVDGLRQMIRSVCLIPGSTEFGYNTQPVAQILGLGASAPENVHQLQSGTDVAAALDHLQALCPNLTGVSLVVSWFGDDLRAGSCRCEPRVDLAGKETSGTPWSAAGLSREEARPTSRYEGRAAYGGTPSDESVVRLIRELKARGLSVTLYPFLMMDVPVGNDLPDPRSGGPGQPAYPWRGRITCDPAPGRPGSPDGTAVAAGQVAAFFGGVDRSRFSVSPSGVVFSGAPEWSFRRLALHYGHLAIVAGGVDAFIIGSELVGLTRIRSGPGAYPAVAALRSLATELRAVLGATTKLTYAADWTEYGAQVLGGGAEIRFPLDPLWADPAIDAVGIDYYPPVSDWRDRPGHPDAALARSQYDVDYLRNRLRAGEAFDWYYPDAAASAAQARLPITDGAYGKPWIYRAKDLVGWWSNPHVERAGGVEIGASAWAPGGKPIWLTEIGIPAVDKGSNGPNVFPDPKSSEAAAPPHSTGLRDDLAQARGLEAILTGFDPALPGHVAGFNPVAGSYAGRMVDPARVSVWTWDARPFPAFPAFEGVWADGANWQAGHWISGRLEGAPLDRLLGAVLADYGLAPATRPPLDGFLDGYVIDRPMSARAAIEPLGRLFGFDAAASGGTVSWRDRTGSVAATVAPESCVAAGEEPLLRRVRAQETDLPAVLELGFTDGDAEYARGAVGSRRLAGGSRREQAVEVAAVTRPAEAQRLADAWLRRIRAGREILQFRLSPREIGLEAGDLVRLAGRAQLYRVDRIVDGADRSATATAIEGGAA